MGAEVISTKAGAKDLLTAVDGECQRVIEEVVSAAHPSGHSFLGEESVPAGAKASAEALGAAMSASDADWLWIVDPIDGTTNFVQSLPMVGVSIGVARRCEGGDWELAVGVIADPFREESSSRHVPGAAPSSMAIVWQSEARPCRRRWLLLDLLRMSSRCVRWFVGSRQLVLELEPCGCLGLQQSCSHGWRVVGFRPTSRQTLMRGTRQRVCYLYGRRAVL